MNSRRARALLMTLATGTVLAACSGTDPAATGALPDASSTRTPGTSSPPPTSATPSLASTPTQTAPVKELPTGMPGEPEVVADGLELPWGIDFEPDGTALVSQRDRATVVRVTADGTVTDVPGTGPGGTVEGVTPDGEGGLLGIAVAPEDPSVLYAYTTTAQDNRVVRMPLSATGLGAPEPIVTGIPKGRIHNGGRIAFGPDGMLYVTTGDSGETGLSPDIDSLGGKVLRVTPDGDPAPGNPDPASPVWTLGHRNVQGIGWDGNGIAYASEFGQNTYDELNRLEAGADYGWPQVEGPGDGGGEFAAPLITWSTDIASPSGLAVTGDAVYLAALRGERLWRVPVADGVATDDATAFLDGDLGRLRAVTVGPDDRLWLLTSNGDDDVVARVPLG